MTISGSEFKRWTEKIGRTMDKAKEIKAENMVDFEVREVSVDILVVALLYVLKTSLLHCVLVVSGSHVFS